MNTQHCYRPHLSRSQCCRSERDWLRRSSRSKPTPYPAPLPLGVTENTGGKTSSTWQGIKGKQLGQLIFAQLQEKHNIVTNMAVKQQQWPILPTRTWDFDSCTVTVWMSGAMGGPCCPVSVNPKLGWGCETPKWPQRGFVVCGPDFSPTERHSFSIDPALVAEGLRWALKCFCSATSTFPLVSLLVTVLVKKLSRGRSCNRGCGSGWVWLWPCDWWKADVRGCIFLFGCGWCGGFASNCCVLQLPKLLKPPCLVSPCGFMVSFST